ncbi:uncharacterized protein LOC124945621 [Impatiens glandulifera]|uniref:uncharacterized protein LOC124945621 n=1 Tax=Impatiens glandulifera TaxID=253017 RepID=UPI001FB17971|nr:uncharacterized protein LOC124945621 [Impatiens glandulifera]
MGGGGVMRAASKFSGIGALRGDHPIFSAARKVTKPTSVYLSSSDDYVKNNVLLTSQEDKIDTAAVQRPCWELDDWEFAGGEEEDELFVGTDEPLPRVVFGGAPTPQEAKDATSDLKDALEKVYLSSPDSDQKKDSPPLSGSSSGVSMIYDLENIGQTEIRGNSVPRNAIQAFQILSDNPAAQSVVASIACDPNVWLAVMDNPELREFLLTKINNSSSSSSCSEIIPLVKESMVCIEFPEDDDPSFLEKKLEELEDRMKEFAKKMKIKAEKMVNNLSVYLNNIFGIQMDGKGCEVDNQNGEFSLMEKALGTSFMGLAVMVIMVVILKRS